jgi:hypothetical protein
MVIRIPASLFAMCVDGADPIALRIKLTCCYWENHLVIIAVEMTVCHFIDSFCHKTHHGLTCPMSRCVSWGLT